MADRTHSSAVFRKKSIERVASPENLDMYIKSTSPALWVVLASIIILLVGVIVWATFGKIDSASVVGIRVENGYAVSYVKEAETSKLNDNSYMEISDQAYPIDSVIGPFVVNSKTDSFLAPSSGLDEGDWYYVVSCKSGLSGDYKGKIVFEKISPISFIMN